MADLIARLVFPPVGRRRRSGDFGGGCCHRIDGRFRAGPPTATPDERT